MTTTYSKKMLGNGPIKIDALVFGHCPNSDCTPLPTLKRALWGTFFGADLNRFVKPPF